MGTSRRRTPPGARLAGPRGRPDRLPRQAKNEQIAVWFQVGDREFVRSDAPWKSFNSALQAIAVSLSPSVLRWQLDRVNPEGWRRVG